MKDTDLFQLALGLTPPWEVVSCEFDPQRQRLDIRLGCPRGSMFACPECGQMGLKAHDTVEKMRDFTENGRVVRGKTATSRSEATLDFFLCL